jgi:hypothetical protein
MQLIAQQSKQTGFTRAVCTGETNPLARMNNEIGSKQTMKLAKENVFFMARIVSSTPR